MGGMRTAGDLVMRLQLARKMRINEAKAFVAKKLNISIEELCDVVTMSDLREDLGFGLAHVEPCAEANGGMEAKFRIAEKLGIKINSVERFKERAGMK
jgi:dimethylamine--corrinoid protein Co-methyltransferase